MRSPPISPALRGTLGATLIGALFAACGGDVPQPEIRLGVLALIEDQFLAASGEPTIQGAMLAAEEINASGGVDVGGVVHRIRLVVLEPDDRVEDVTTKARRLINRDSIHALVGPQLSRHAIPVAGVAEDARVPMISPMSSNPETTRGREYVFRLAFLDLAQGEALAHYAWDDLEARHVGVLTDVADPYSRDLSELFGDRFSALGGRVSRERFVGGGVESPAAALRTLVSSGVERIFLPIGPGDVVRVLQEADALPEAPPFLGADTWSLDAVRGFASAEGAALTHQWHRDLPVDSTRVFVERFRARFGTDARTTGALTYDAVRVLAKAARRSGSLDGGRLRDALLSLPRFSGASGAIHFAGSHDPARSVVISAIHAGAHGPAAVVDP